MSGNVKVAGVVYVDFSEVRSFGIAGSADGYEVYCLSKGSNEEKKLVTVLTHEVAAAIMEGLGWAKHTKQDVDLLELVTRSYEDHIAKDGKA